MSSMKLISSRLGVVAVLALSLISLNAADAKKAAADPTAPKWKKVFPSTPPGVTCTTNVLAEYPEHTVTMVVYSPDKPGKYPAILDIHGGGWQKRQVESDKPMMERLAARGFVTALVSYRLSGEAKYPAALDDSKAAVRWMRANAKKFKIDPERIGVMGGSAGGHLSGLLAMTSGLKEFEGKGPYQKESSSVKACIVMASTMDLAAAYGEKTSTNVVAFLSGTGKEVPEVYKQASPITHVRKGVPPTIFIEGEKDTLKIGRAEMQEKFRALGIETEVYTLKHAPHPYWMSEPWVSETVEIADKFFKKHLGVPKH